MQDVRNISDKCLDCKYRETNGLFNCIEDCDCEDTWSMARDKEINKEIGYIICDVVVRLRDIKRRYGLKDINIMMLFLERFNSIV